MRPEQASNFILQKSIDTKVIPMLVIDDVSVANVLAKILIDADIRLMEVALRTKSAFNIIEVMANIPGTVVAVGTVLDSVQLQKAQAAGAQFAVSPGYTTTLGEASIALNMPLLPGASTPTEVMQLNEKGYHFIKFFPAEANGGVGMLRSLAEPLPQVKFCPTGGINGDNANTYLSLPNVTLVAGSWLVTKDDIRGKNWKAVERKVKAFHHV